MKKPVCAVTGANGFIGAAVAHKFETLGWRVIRLVRSPQPESGEARSFHLGEAVSPEILADVELLVHAAYDFSLRSWSDIRRINVCGGEKLFDAATRQGVRRQILISSLAAFEGCKSKYGLAKLAIEEAGRSRAAVIVRPGIVYDEINGGIAASIAAAARKMPILPMIGRGYYPLYTCHLGDLCSLIATLAQMDAPALEPIVAAHPTPITLRAIAECARRKGAFQIIVPIPWWLLFAVLRVAEMGGKPPLFRSDSVISLVYGNRKVERLAFAVSKFGSNFRPHASLEAAAGEL